jgi:hypothetical protein
MVKPGYMTMGKLARMVGIRKPKRDHKRKETLLAVDEQFVNLQQELLAPKNVSKKKKGRKPVTKVEMEESIDKLEALLRG